MTTAPPAPPNWANKTSAIAAVLALACGVLWYVARLDARMDQVETVVADRARDNSYSTTERVTCGELAAKVAEAYRAGDGRTVAQPLERLMDRMGCVAP